MGPIDRQPYHRSWFWQHESSNAKGWAWFPIWAEYFLDLGAAIARRVSESETRFTIALTLPTDSYSSALITSGIIVESWAISKQRTPEQHLEYLKQLNENTTVNYHCPGSTDVLQGQLMGFDGQFFNFHYRKAGAQLSKLMLRADLSKHLEIAPIQKDQVPTRVRRRERAMQHGLTSSLQDASGSSLTLLPQLECSIVCRESKIRNDLLGIEMALISDENHAIGTLQDIVKLDRFIDRGIVEPYSTRYVSTDARPSTQVTPTPIVIFDGARSYLLQQSEYEESTRIVIANRSEARFADLVNDINTGIAYGKHPTELTTYSTTPRGVEIIGYSH